MFSWLLLLFVGIPLVELALLLKVGSLIGVLPTVGLVMTTGVLGAALARSQGIKAFMAVQGELAGGRLPGASLMNGLAVLVGGTLLLTPGILTDVFGFSLLVPFTRSVILRSFRRSMERNIREGRVQVHVFSPGGFPSPGQDDLDGRTEVQVEKKEIPL